MTKKEIKCICKGLGKNWLEGNSSCPIHYPKFEYRFCDYCGQKLVEIPREHRYDKHTGKQLQWVQCPAHIEDDNHSRWIKELVQKG